MNDHLPTVVPIATTQNHTMTSREMHVQTNYSYSCYLSHYLYKLGPSDGFNLCPSAKRSARLNVPRCYCTCCWKWPVSLPAPYFIIGRCWKYRAQKIKQRRDACTGILPTAGSCNVKICSVICNVMLWLWQIHIGLLQNITHTLCNYHKSLDVLAKNNNLILLLPHFCSFRLDASSPRVHLRFISSGASAASLWIYHVLGSVVSKN